MKYLLLALLITGCSSFELKKVDFYRNGVLVKSFNTRGIFEGNEQSGIYKLWAEKRWSYYTYKCEKCTYTVKEK